MVTITKPFSLQFRFPRRFWLVTKSSFSTTCSNNLMESTCLVNRSTSPNQSAIIHENDHKQLGCQHPINEESGIEELLGEVTLS
jgi:hypothetical protein